MGAYRTKSAPPQVGRLILFYMPLFDYVRTEIPAMFLFMQLSWGVWPSCAKCEGVETHKIVVLLSAFQPRMRSDSVQFRCYYNEGVRDL